MKVDFNYVILDSGYDAWYIYWWICLLGGKPIVAINPRNSQTPIWNDIYSRRARIEPVIGDTVPNNGLKSPLFRDVKNFFVRTALVCMLQHAKAIAETLESIDYQKIAV
jgi:hypothetical protein